MNSQEKGRRDLLIKKINLFMETCSDKQIDLLDSTIKEMISSQYFKDLNQPTPFVGWGKDCSTYEGIILKTRKK